MLIGGFEPPTSPLPRVRSTNWAISAFGAGSGNRTRIISLEGWGNSHYTMPASWNSATWFSFCTEYREKLSLFEPVSELIVSGYAIAWPKLVVGEGFEPSKSVTADLQSAPFGRSGTPPDLMVPTTGIELVTYWLQVSCSTYWAKSASSSAHSMETCEFMQLKNCIICFIGHILCDTMKKQPNGGQISTLFQHHCAQQCAPAKP